MKPEKDTKEYFKKWKEVKLSETSRARMKENLLEYARFHEASETERVGEESRSIERVQSRTLWITRLRIRTMPIVALAVVLLVGGGTSFAAQGSVPGDLLYPVKTGFNESIRSTLAFGADAEARLQADLLEERLEEAEKLEAEGRLEGELATELESRIESHAMAAEPSSDGESSVAARSDSRVKVALDRFNALINGGGSLAVNDDARMSMEADESGAATNLDMGMSTMMAVEEISLEELREMTEKNIENLRSIIDRRKAELSADVHAELSTRLTEATELMVRAETQAEAESRQTMFEAADLAGQIEATLSLLGKVEIDPETGMIVDVDLSAPPILDMPVEYRGEINGSGSSGSGVDGNTGIEIDISDDMIEVEGEAEASSQINL